MSELLLVGATEELQTLARDLERAGFHVDACALDEADERFARGERIDVLLINLVDGDDLARLLPVERQSGHTATVAVMRSEQLAGLDGQLPLDDFVVVPVSTEELLTRIRRATARRAASETADVLVCGDLTIDQASYRVFVGSRPVELTYKEYELLRFLALNQDKVCSRELLLSHVWGYDFYGGERTVDVHIRRLRSKIEGRGHTFIETVRNVGYRFHAG
ncbi:MAG: response regulator transcription factor [Dehalococcoidia bacterium]